MKTTKVIVFLLCSIAFSIKSNAQSAELKSAFDQLNQTLKEYTLGTDEFRPYLMKEYGDRFEYKKIQLSYSYPNFIFEYIIGEKTEYAGWVRDIKEGSYKVTIPLSSMIVFINDYQVSFINENGLTKNSNGKSSLITAFPIYADERLTAKKYYSELRRLWDLIKIENYQGNLGTTHKKKTNTTSKSGKEKKTNTKESNKLGKYVQ